MQVVVWIHTLRAANHNLFQHAARLRFEQERESVRDVKIFIAERQRRGSSSRV